MLVSPAVDAAVAGVFGLLFGSFLNVVIYRLPQMLERQWAAECADLTGKPVEAAAPFNLVRPGSRCRECGHVIRWYENIPVVSYLALRGKCSHCGAPIAPRYPVDEAVTAALFAYCFWRFGFTPRAAVWSAVCAALLALALIDWDTTLLPDDITLPLVWGGLIAAALGWSGLKLPQAMWGAVAGYVSLWLVYQAFKLLTGKEGMGYGDFKLFAALGAWFGAPALIPIILMASVTGAVIGIAMKMAAGLREGKYVPFGPFLAAGGFAALFFGSDNILAAIGL
jgi:leader peptidase (prepilin peptidase)/N-methyltransferase